MTVKLRFQVSFSLEDLDVINLDKEPGKNLHQKAKAIIKQYLALKYKDEKVDRNTLIESIVKEKQATLEDRALEVIKSGTEKQNLEWQEQYPIVYDKVIRQYAESQELIQLAKDLLSINKKPSDAATTFNNIVFYKNIKKWAVMREYLKETGIGWQSRIEANSKGNYQIIINNEDWVNFATIWLKGKDNV